MSPASWWGTKVRQLRTHVVAHVATEERRVLAAWTTPAEMTLFETMHVADQRHGLDVVAWLQRAGVRDRDVLAAGLLHDCAKGATGAGPRVAWSLGEAFGPWVPAAAAIIPGWADALERLRTHAEASADLCAQAGLPSFAVDLVRHQETPVDPRWGAVFHAADEAC